MFKQEFHLWDFPASKTWVKLEEELTNRLYEVAEEKIGIDKLRKILSRRSEDYGIKRKVSPKELYSYKEKNIHPLWLLLELAGVTSYPLEEIEKGVEFYGGKSGTRVYPREFPILHSTKLDYLSGIFSSSHKDYERHRIVKEKVGEAAYKIAKEVLGEFKVYRRVSPTIVHIVFPPIVNEVLEKIHPRAGLDEPKENIVAYILGIFTNKGCVGPSWLEIDKKDEKFLSYVQGLSEIIGLHPKISRRKTEYSLRFCKPDSVRFVELVENLKGLNFSPYHEGLISKRIKRKRSSYLSSIKREESIREVLKEGAKSIEKISAETGFSYFRTWHYIKCLEKEGIVKPVGRKKMGRTSSKIYELVEG